MVKAQINCLTEIQSCGFNYTLRISDINNAKKSAKKNYYIFSFGDLKNLFHSYIFIILLFYIHNYPPPPKKKEISLFHLYLEEINSP